MMDYSEKRDYIRMTMACEMQIRNTDSNDAHTVTLEDLSATGMRFFSDQELREGQALAVTIRPGSGITPPMEAEIAVLRCQPLEDHFDVAATIHHIQPASYPDT